MKLRHSSLAILALGVALAACGRTGAPAPVELRGMGSGETSRSSAPTGYAANSAPTQLTNDAGVYAPPPSYSSRSGVQTENLGEPQDAYSQQIMSPPAAPVPAQQQQVVLGQQTQPTELSAPAPVAAASETIDQGTGEYGWPLRGRIISGFGPKSDGQVNDGINIAAGKGSPVYASKAGVVTYAGNELRNFGNMVLVKHPGGMFTVYAHLDQIQVSKDQNVQKAQVVGTVGTSGGVSEPQLHFEVRQGSNPQDPTKYLSR